MGGTHFRVAVSSAMLVSAPSEVVAAGVLYAAYVKWCKKASTPAVTETRFGRGMSAFGYQKDKRRTIRYSDIVPMK